MLGGHLALVQGGALVGQDNPRAIAKLDLARLLMPTSLVEEAALRREIRAIDPQKNREKIVALATMYVARYRESPYARLLIADLRALIFSPGIDAEPAFVSKLEPVLDIAPASERLEIYLALCRTALARGRFDEARQRLAKALAAADTGQAHERLKAYQSLIARLDAPFKQVSGANTATPSAALTPEDRQIIALVQAVLTRLTLSPAQPRRPEDKSPPDEETELVAKARLRLERVDMLLNGKKTK